MLTPGLPVAGWCVWVFTIVSGVLLFVINTKLVWIVSAVTLSLTLVHQPCFPACLLQTPNTKSQGHPVSRHATEQARLPWSN